MNEGNSSEATDLATAKESANATSKRSLRLDDWTMLVTSLACIGSGIVLAFWLVKRGYHGTAGWVAAISFVLIGGLIVILRHVELYGNDGRRRLILRREAEDYGAESADEE